MGHTYGGGILNYIVRSWSGRGKYNVLALIFPGGAHVDNLNLDYSDDYARKRITIGRSELDHATLARLWIYGVGCGRYVSGDSHYLQVNNDSDKRVWFNPLNKFGEEGDLRSWGWRFLDIPIDWLIEGDNEFYIYDSKSHWTESNLRIAIDTNDYGNSDIQANWKDKPGELMMFLELIRPFSDDFET